MRQSGRRFMRCGMLVVGCILSLCATAQAQRWENAYGGPTTEETARNGVRPVLGGGGQGGYVSVGGSPLGAGEDIYVVRTDNFGLLGWSKTYSIGNEDVATDIEEVLTATGQHNGFIITGYTNHGVAGNPCARSEDIFLLRIDRCGAVIWQNTYGDPTANEQAWDVIVTTLGDGITTNPGDFAVAGWQVSAPGRDGYLLRTNAAGAIVWGLLYRGPQNDRDDYFYSLDEGTDVSQGQTAGQIIAAGGTTSYRPAANLDAWIVRVNGNNGAVAFASAFGSATTVEDLRSVQELNTGGFQGDIVAVGQTTQGANTDAYMIQTDPALNPVIHRRHGFNLLDEARYVREIPGAPNVPSIVVMTGYITPPFPWGFGGEDAFLLQLTTGTLAPAANESIYGTSTDDLGWSVEPVLDDDSANCVTTGFIVAGYIETSIVAPNDPRQLYMFKTDANQSTGCERSFTAPTQELKFDKIPQIPLTTSLRRECLPPIVCFHRFWAEVICALNRDNTDHCQISTCVPQLCQFPPPAPQPDSDPDFSDRMQTKSGDATYARGAMVMEQ